MKNRGQKVSLKGRNVAPWISEKTEKLRGNN